MEGDCHRRPAAHAEAGVVYKTPAGECRECTFSETFERGGRGKKTKQKLSLKTKFNRDEGKHAGNYWLPFKGGDGV